MNDEELDTLIAELTTEGLIEPVFHEDGTVGMKVIPSPDNPLWNLHLKEIDEDIAQLMELGIVEIAGMTEDGDITYLPTEYGREILDES